MSLIRSGIRSAVLRWAPTLGNSYRLLRDRRAAARPAVRTAYGFTFVGDESMVNGTFERDEIETFVKHLENVSVCVDIGANIGLYTCIAASCRKHVLAVEPLPRNLDLLYRNVLDNNFDNVEVFPLGLSSNSGIQRIFGTGTCASLLEGWAGTSKHSYKLIPTSQLDLILNNRFDDASMLIKMDVEGLELEVLRGAEQTLKRNHRPTWLVEIALSEHFPGGLNGKFCETFQMFYRHGYQARIADAEGRIVQPKDVERWAQQGYVEYGSHNYLFT